MPAALNCSGAAGTPATEDISHALLSSGWSEEQKSLDSGRNLAQ